MFSATSVADQSLAPSNVFADTITPDGFGGSICEVSNLLNWALDGLADFGIHCHLVLFYISERTTRDVY